MRARRDIELRLVAKVEPDGPTHKLIAELGISDIVHLTSGLSDADLAALFASAEVACIPSLYEGFSLPAVEATFGSMGGLLATARLMLVGPPRSKAGADEGPLPSPVPHLQPNGLPALPILK